MRTYLRRLTAAALIGFFAQTSAAFSACTPVNDFRYMGTNGRVNVASVTPTDIHMPTGGLPGFPGAAIHTDDPDWHVTDVLAGNSGNFKQILYLTQDGSQWSAEFHCRYKDPDIRVRSADANAIHCWLEHKPLSGGSGHDADGILYLDDQKRPMLASIPLISSWPASPKFCVRPWTSGMQPSWKDN